MLFDLVKIRTNPWTEVEILSPENIDLGIGSQVVVKTENGLEAGEVIGFRKSEEEREEYRERKLIRKLASDDSTKIQENEKRKGPAEVFCRKMIKKHDLPMKLVDTYFPLDGGKIIFAFVADGRVDFRELVKDLTRHFQKSIRLQQVGMRDEAKRVGGFGPCGRELCCIRFKKELGNVTTDLARDQQIAHRGSERLSGVCGRLMCCLGFEEYLYQELARDFPPLESIVKTKQGKGRVVAINVIKGTYKVELADKSLIEISLSKKLNNNK